LVLNLFSASNTNISRQPATTTEYTS